SRAHAALRPRTAISSAGRGRARAPIWSAPPWRRPPRSPAPSPMCASCCRVEEKKMEPFTRLDAVAAPMPVPNVDTDQIIPARFLRKSRKDGYGQYLFCDLRFAPDGTEKPGFVLNQAPYRGARILVADKNFGCGSSREHAVYALWDYGFRAVIAPSFGDIFFNNCFKNGLLPIVLPAERAGALRAELVRQPGAHLKVDLERQEVVAPS